MLSTCQEGNNGEQWCKKNQNNEVKEYVKCRSSQMLWQEEGISNSLYEVVVLKGWEGQPFTEQRRMFKAEEAKYGGKKEAFCIQW